jgi:capsid protein
MERDMSWPFNTARISEEEAPWVWPDTAHVEQQIKPKAATTFSNPSTGWNGEHFPGVLGQIDEIAGLDYWALRARSGTLFRTNSYAIGIVNRLVTNVINTGLEPEFSPEEGVLGVEEDSLKDWADDKENRYRIYARCKDIIDTKGYRVDGEIQAQIYKEAFIDGDCLVTCPIHKETELPQTRFFSGNRIQTPPLRDLDENIVDGVHIDENGKHLGYWVRDDSKGPFFHGEYTYVPAYGQKTGRRTAWLVYGPNKREDDVRGMPGLGIAIQPLKAINDYRGAAQLKASINSMIVGFIKRQQETGKMPALSNAAVRAGTVSDVQENRPVGTRNILPGVYFEYLNAGEEPVPYSYHGTDVNFASFEAAILAGLAWAMEIPAEILLLSFKNNYSASQAVIREFWMFLVKERSRFASQHCQNLLEEWFISEIRLGKIEAEGFLEALIDPTKYDIKQAWLTVDWLGAIKPSVDIMKEVNAHKGLVSEGWETNTQATKILTGGKWDKNIRKVARENDLKAAAMEPILRLQREYGSENVTNAMRVLGIGGPDFSDIVDDEHDGAAA